MQHAFHPSALRHIPSLSGLSTNDEHITESHGGTASEWDLGQLAKEIQRNIVWASEGDPRSELERAVAMLAARLR